MQFFLSFPANYFFFRKKIKPKFSFIRFPRSSIKLIHTLITWYFREKKYSLFPSSRQWPTEKYSVRIRCGGSIICGNMIIGDGDDSGGGGGRFWWWPYCKPTIFRVLEISPRRREYFSPQIKPLTYGSVLTTRVWEKGMIAKFILREPIKLSRIKVGFGVETIEGQWWASNTGMSFGSKIVELYSVFSFRTRFWQGFVSDFLYSVLR